MQKRYIKMERSPFNKTRNMKAPRGSDLLQTQVSQDLFEDFMLYARQYNAEHKNERGLSNKANPLKHIINDFLNRNALERRSYTDLYVIMAFNKINFDSPFNTDEVQGEVIGFVKHPEKFTKFHPFHMHNRYEKNIVYALETFDKELFDELNLKTFDRDVLFGVHPAMQEDFDMTRETLQDIYRNIDFDNAQICMFNLNNYLDHLQDGVYIGDGSTYSHEGFVVMLDPDDIYMTDSIIGRFTWSYVAGVLEFKFYVESVGLFNTETCYKLPADVFREYWSISSGFLSQQAKLKMSLKSSRERVETYKESIEREERRQEKIREKLDYLKQS